MTTTDVPAGINYTNVSRYFAEHIEGGDVPLTFTLIGDGRSNLTYRVTGGGRTWVLRRPPLGHVLPTAHDMAREFRVLDGLSKTNVPVPKPFALCEDTSVNEYPFYVMEYREGVIIVSELPEGYATTPEERRRMSLALVDTLVALHAVDYNAIGLGEFGHPEGYLERQVRRWSQQWERSKTRELPEIDELIRRLRASVPESPAPAIVHGDYRLGNMALDPNDPGKVLAIFDWEMSTLGDPLSDLGYTLVYWGQANDSPERIRVRPNAQVTAKEGFLTRDELVAEYGRRSGRNVDHIDWYEVFALYKLAVIVEGIYARVLQGKTVGEGFQGYDQSSVNLVNLALEQSSQSENPKLRGEF
ncbi:MAG: phosphotransferase family protein [Hyphomicrobiales bacterium]